MRGLVLAAITIAVVATSCGKTLRPGYCRVQSDCMGGVCDVDGGTWKCLYDAGTTTDARTDMTDGPDGGDAADAPIEKPFRCTTTADCADAGMSGVCQPTTGACVECLPTDNPCTGTKPICVVTTCAPCTKDTDCTAAPGICMTDGHCATEGEVIYVDYTATACPGNGNSATPFCRLASVFPTADRRVVIIRGPADDKVQLNTTGVRPVIIGRKNAASADASIPAGAGTAIVVGSDEVLIRDLVVAGGIAATAKGFVVSGSSTKLSLVNVRVALGMGLGVQADTGAYLLMDRCSVQNNSAGGILLDGATFNVRNTIVTGNGPGTLGPITWGGILVNNPPQTGPKLLELLTVQNNNQVGIVCTAAVSNTVGVLVSGNQGGEINPTCNFMSCGTPSATCGAQP